ncbi:hypothetical protein H6G76_12000 [Nostoc sp. FACHB-152]|uniref:hypothetical protein n=1 Tax=unclassified Nostoc TaxID=2593658 RepID=UPI0016883460|nr:MULTISPECIES: hypothetical protein [unclassified Nostoc]MBD2447887.1 hypothetical protein [Nostoc sp. FACHB-152]MBD2468539.1 hypothetical protein [Nostoc sp. FACHB-145]
MASYSEDDLLNAVRQQIRKDRQFAKNLSAAVERKDSNYLTMLIKQVAEMVFGAVVQAVITGVLALLGGY